MHLRDGESGGAAYQAAGDTAPYSNSPSVDPSSSRTIHLKSGVPSAAEFLLAWILVLYRDNDDSLGSVSWGSTDTSSASSLDVKAVPFTKSDSLSSSLEAIRQLAGLAADGALPRKTYFFNDATQSRSETQKQSQRRPHDVSA